MIALLVKDKFGATLKNVFLKNVVKQTKFNIKNVHM
jgi:hypothetical protein